MPENDIILNIVCINKLVLVLIFSAVTTFVCCLIGYSSKQLTDRMKILRFTQRTEQVIDLIHVSMQHIY